MSSRIYLGKVEYDQAFWLFERELYRELRSPVWSHIGVKLDVVVRLNKEGVASCSGEKWSGTDIPVLLNRWERSTETMYEQNRHNGIKTAVL